jgi:hypothetical protein
MADSNYDAIFLIAYSTWFIRRRMSSPVFGVLGIWI